MNLGYTDINSVRRALEQNKLDLYDNARIGVKFYEDFQEKMDRNEVERIGEIVIVAGKKYFKEAEIDLSLITEMKTAEGYVAPIMCKKDDEMLKALVMFVREEAAIGTVAHEAVHMVNHVFDYVGQDLCTVNDEAQAYLTGYFVQRFMENIRGEKPTKAKALNKRVK